MSGVGPFFGDRLEKYLRCLKCLGYFVCGLGSFFLLWGMVSREEAFALLAAELNELKQAGLESISVSDETWALLDELQPTVAAPAATMESIPRAPAALVAAL